MLSRDGGSCYSGGEDSAPATRPCHSPLMDSVFMLPPGSPLLKDHLSSPLYVAASILGMGAGGTSTASSTTTPTPTSPPPPPSPNPVVSSSPLLQHRLLQSPITPKPPSKLVSPLKAIGPYNRSKSYAQPVKFVGLNDNNNQGLVSPGGPPQGAESDGRKAQGDQGKGGVGDGASPTLLNSLKNFDNQDQVLNSAGGGVCGSGNGSSGGRSPSSLLTSPAGQPPALSPLDINLQTFRDSNMSTSTDHLLMDTNVDNGVALQKCNALYQNQRGSLDKEDNNVTLDNPPTPNNLEQAIYDTRHT